MVDSLYFHPLGEIINATIRYFTCPKASKKGPRRSIPHLLNSQWDMIMESSSARATWKLVCFWHFGNFFM